MRNVISFILPLLLAIFLMYCQQEVPSTAPDVTEEISDEEALLKMIGEIL